MIYRITYIMIEHKGDEIKNKSLVLESEEPPLLPPLGQTMVVTDHHEGTQHQGTVLGYMFEQKQFSVAFKEISVVDIRVYGRSHSDEWLGWPV